MISYIKQKNTQKSKFIYIIKNKTKQNIYFVNLNKVHMKTKRWMEKYKHTLKTKKNKKLKTCDDILLYEWRSNIRVHIKNWITHKIC